MSEATTENATLTPQQRIFVSEYLIDLNGKQAAIRAGYSEKTAEVQASRLLSQAKVKAALEDAMEMRAARTGVTQDYVISSLRKVADRCMQAVPVMEKVDGQWVETGEFKFDSPGANKALELMGKHLRLWNEVGSKENPMHLLSEEQIDKELAALLAKAQQ